MFIDHFDDPVGDDELDLFDHTAVKAVLFMDASGTFFVQTYGMMEENRESLEKALTESGL